MVLINTIVIIFAWNFNNYILGLLLIVNIICLVMKAMYNKNDLNGSLLLIWISDYVAIIKIQFNKPLASKFYIFLIVSFFILILINTLLLNIAYINEIKTPQVVFKLPKMLQLFHVRPAFVKKIAVIFKSCFAIISYIFITFLVILTFSSIYSYISFFTDTKNSLVDSLPNSIYYSATTYFTVGYGDITPKTSLLKMASVIEMGISNFLNVIFIPLIIALFLDFLNTNIIHTQKKEVK